VSGEVTDWVKVKYNERGTPVERYPCGGKSAATPGT